jgi:serine/threonine-protein kinase
MFNTAVADLVGRVLASRYRLLAPIGTGASGRVFLADDVRLRRRVAVKVLHSGLAEDAGFLRRFRAEAQMAAALHHPHVVAVYDWGEDDGIPFMVLELLKGGSLRGLLDSGTRLSPPQAAHVGRQVLAALRYAHTRGLVHRDVKPANLLFDEHGVVRVADFGLARALADASWTEPSGTVIGTARYAAPEQASTGAVDGRADLYSLAVVLTEACTGDVPLVGDSAIGTLATRATRPIEAPPELGPLVPVIEHAGRSRPSERFADASAMGRAITDAGKRMPAPAPLPLAGLGDGVEDVEPTTIGRATRGDATTTRSSDDTVGEDVPVAINVEPGMRRSAVPVAVAVAIVAVLAIAAAAVFAGGSGATAPVPNLVGHSFDDPATKALATDAGLLVRVVERRRSDDPAGLIIEQHPAPGDFLAEGDEIEVVVSRGPPPVPLPELVGKPVAEAQALLEQAGFVAVVEPRYDENVPKDIVLATEPPSPGNAPRDSAVKVIVSNGPAPVAVPDVTGKTFEEAVQILGDKRFSAARHDEFNDLVPVGVVIRTDPPAGNEAPRDSEVAVFVSKGPEIVTVPPVVGVTVEEASARLAAVGLTPDVQNYGPGKVVRASDPAEGAQLPKGSEVTLFL